MVFSINRYSEEQKGVWDDFVKNSWNGVFLFYRNFMDYHSDAFKDHSLMVYKGKKLKAVLPANEENGILWSHKGLTYGGWVLTPRFGADDLDVLFQEVEGYLVQKGISSIRYKQKPYVFDKNPNDSDGWVLWKNNYELFRRDLSFFIDFENITGFAKDKRYRLNKAGRNNLTITENDDLVQFMALVKYNLNQKYETDPVHSYDEALLLQTRFPQNIKTYCVYQEYKFLGGTWLFLDNDFIHTQYFHFNDEGKELCAVEFLVDHLINKYGSQKRYLSFGTSTEDGGTRLNSGLAAFKEGFGATSFCHDFYKKYLCK